MFKLIAMECKLSEANADTIENAFVKTGTALEMAMLGTAFIAKAVFDRGERAACYVVVDANGVRVMHDEITRG